MSGATGSTPLWSSSTSSTANLTCKLTFDRVAALPNARISILPVPGVHSHNYSNSNCSHGLVDLPRQQARLNIGKVHFDGQSSTCSTKGGTFEDTHYCCRPHQVDTISPFLKMRKSWTPSELRPGKASSLDGHARGCRLKA